jgi:hypothetical protein
MQYVCQKITDSMPEALEGRERILLCGFENLNHQTH